MMWRLPFQPSSDSCESSERSSTSSPLRYQKLRSHSEHDSIRITRSGPLDAVKANGEVWQEQPFGISSKLLHLRYACPNDGRRPRFPESASLDLISTFGRDRARQAGGAALRQSPSAAATAPHSSDNRSATAR